MTYYGKVEFFEETSGYVRILNADFAEDVIVRSSDILGGNVLDEGLEVCCDVDPNPDRPGHFIAVKVRGPAVRRDPRVLPVALPAPPPPTHSVPLDLLDFPGGSSAPQHRQDRPATRAVPQPHGHDARDRLARPERPERQARPDPRDRAQPRGGSILGGDAVEPPPPRPAARAPARGPILSAGGDDAGFEDPPARSTRRGCRGSGRGEAGGGGGGGGGGGAMERHRGIVITWFDKYGFIRAPSFQKDVFVQRGGVVKNPDSNSFDLEVNQNVEFRVKFNPKKDKYEAMDVVVVS